MTFYPGVNSALQMIFAMVTPPFLVRPPFLARAFWPAIVALFQSGGPFAIPRRVVAVVVDTFDGVFIRRKTHVGKEVLEGKPASADANTATAIILKPFVVRIHAAVNHGSPDPIDSRSTHPVRVSPRIVGSETTTRFGVPGEQRIRPRCELPSAVALTAVYDLVSRIVRKTFKNCNTVDVLSNQVYVFHGWMVLHPA